MNILAVRTDKLEAELYLFDDGKQLGEVRWQAHRELAETIHKQLAKLLNKSSISLENIDGIVCFRGPGSFTGLRIGLSVANALAYSLDIPIVSAAGEHWLRDGIDGLNSSKNDKIAVPEYGALAKTTPPKK